jgi:hypothetical protein
MGLHFNAVLYSCLTIIFIAKPIGIIFRGMPLKGVLTLVALVPHNYRYPPAFTCRKSGYLQSQAYGTRNYKPPPQFSRQIRKFVRFLKTRGLYATLMEMPWLLHMKSKHPSYTLPHPHSKTSS